MSVDDLIQEWDDQMSANLKKLDEEHEKKMAELETTTRIHEIRRKTQELLHREEETGIAPRLHYRQPQWVLENSLFSPARRTVLASTKVTPYEVRLWEHLTTKMVVQGNDDKKRRSEYIRRLNGLYERANHLREEKRKTLKRWHEKATSPSRPLRSVRGFDGSKALHSFKEKLEALKRDIVHLSHTAETISLDQAERAKRWCESKEALLRDTLTKMEEERSLYEEAMGTPSFGIYKAMVEALEAKTRVDLDLYAKIIDRRKR